VGKIGVEAVMGEDGVVLGHDGSCW
jgi:hypothetical protein